MRGPHRSRVIAVILAFASAIAAVTAFHEHESQRAVLRTAEDRNAAFARWFATAVSTGTVSIESETGNADPGLRLAAGVVDPDPASRSAAPAEVTSPAMPSRSESHVLRVDVYGEDGKTVMSSGGPVPVAEEMHAAVLAASAGRPQTRVIDLVSSSSDAAKAIASFVPMAGIPGRASTVLAVYTDTDGLGSGVFGTGRMWAAVAAFLLGLTALAYAARQERQVIPDGQWTAKQVRPAFGRLETGVALQTDGEKRRLSQLAAAAALVVGMIGAAVGALELASLRQFGEIERLWNEYDRQAETKERALDTITSRLGYGGMIHDFKNFVLRGEPTLASRVEDHFGALDEAMDGYRSSSMTVEETQALESLMRTVDEYRSKLPVTRRASAGGLPPAEIDARVRVDDRAALDAFQALRDAGSQARGAAVRETHDAVAGMKTILWIGLVLLPLILATAAVVVWLFQRLKRAIDRQATTEAVLRTTGENLAQAQRIGRMGSWAIEIGANSMTWSNQLYEVFGYSRDGVEASYDAFLDTVHPADRDRVRQAIDAAVHDGEQLRVEHRLANTEGGEKHIRQLGEVEYDEHGYADRIAGTAQDITEQCAAAGMLQENVRFIEAVLDSLDFGVLVVDASLVARYANRAYRQLWDVPGDVGDEPTLQTLIELGRRKQAGTEADHSWNAYVDDTVHGVRTGMVQPTEIECADGTILLYRCSLFPDGGRILTYTDVTDRRRAEQETDRQKTLLEAMFHSVSDGMIVTDTVGTIKFSNRSTIELFGYDRDELNGRSSSLLCDNGEPIERQVHVDGDANLDDDLNTDVVDYRRKDGDGFRGVTAVTSIRTASNDVIGFLIVVRDITLRDALQNELRLRTRALEASSTGILITGAAENDYPIQYVNKTFERVTGYSANEAIGRNARFLHGEDGDQPGLKRIKDALRDGRAVVATVCNWRKDGTPFWNELHIAPVRDEDGEITNYIGIQTDISQRIRVEEALRESENRLLEAQRIAGMGNWRWEISTDRLWWSDEIYRVFGVEPGEFEPTYSDFLNAVHPDDREAVDAAVRRALDGEPYNLDHRIVWPDGSIRFIHEQGEITHDENGRPIRMDGIARDITDERKAAETLQKLSLAVEQSPSSVVITDTQGTIEYVNQKYVEVTGYAFDEVVGKNPRDLKSGYMPNKVYEELWQTITEGKEWRGELYNMKKSGDLFWEAVSISPIKDDRGTITHYLALKEDITLRKKFEERLVYQANYDPLTDLPNRSLALDRLSTAIASAKRQKRMVAAMLLDLDQFKHVNDTLGHQAGDDLLKESATRLRACVRETDTVARLGGDEFLIVLPNLSAPRDAENAAQKVLSVFSKAFRLQEHEVFVTTSIGISVYPGDADDAAILIKNADAAMYRTKERGRNSHHFFTPEMDEEAHRRMTIVTRLRRAVDMRRFDLNLQPIVDIKTGQVVAAEALVRWHDSKLGHVSPAQFIPVAEESGLILAISDWVLETACKQATRRTPQTGIPPRVAVNISARHFREECLPETIARVLTASGLEADRLELEITETLMMQDVERTVAIMEAIRGMGVSISIDDFGTDYSSLAYLKRFPVETLKIDRSFVRDVTEDPTDAALASAIMAMAKGFGLKVIGEGVETEKQLEFLSSRGCEFAQGYFFSKPLDPDTFAKFLAEDQQVRRVA